MHIPTPTPTPTIPTSSVQIFPNSIYVIMNFCTSVMLSASVNWANGIYLSALGMVYLCQTAVFLLNKICGSLVHGTTKLLLIVRLAGGERLLMITPVRLLLRHSPILIPSIWHNNKFSLSVGPPCPNQRRTDDYL